MIEREIPVTNKLGLHARASAKLVQLLSGYRSRAKMVAKGREIDAKSTMGVMMLAAGKGTQVHLLTEGEQDNDAMDALVELINNFFDEGE